MNVAKGAAKGAAIFSPLIAFLPMTMMAIIPVFFKTLISEKRRKLKGNK